MYVQNYSPLFNRRHMYVPPEVSADPLQGGPAEGGQFSKNLITLLCRIQVTVQIEVTVTSLVKN